jgi:hypothetical protein
VARGRPDSRGCRLLLGGRKDPFAIIGELLAVDDGAAAFVDEGARIGSSSVRFGDRIRSVGIHGARRGAVGQLIAMMREVDCPVVIQLQKVPSAADGAQVVSQVGAGDIVEQRVSFRG